MSTVAEIENAVQNLSKEELRDFRAWFEKFDAEAWDLQFEEDALSGKLDSLAEDALGDLRSGRCRDL